MTSLYQIIDKHAVIYMLCSKWTSHCISHLRLHPSMRDYSKKSILAKQINDSIYLSQDMLMSTLLNLISYEYISWSNTLENKIFSDIYFMKLSDIDFMSNMLFFTIYTMMYMCMTYFFGRIT